MGLQDVLFYFIAALFYFILYVRPALLPQLSRNCKTDVTSVTE